MAKEIIAFKTTRAQKQAIKIAAARSGKDNVSEFILSELFKNKVVAEELKKSLKKVA